ncbi:YraN family protein [Gammaproteobacteria bacterium AB-CW1]|uniref:UPF0102 protein VCB98_03360 n=1 Tax=Natronospira elongata TaxID=3110268 RepID=A0AAP6MLN9_9GAMM|nr:YraN family protein [Gammaproteobacteria bacterium AB-CW1]
MSRERGKAAETFAEQWLAQKGLQPLERNLHLAGAELDLVMLDGDTVVFVEVRHRQQDDYGDGIETVSRRKRRLMARAAECFMATRGPDRDGRFDLIAIDGSLESPRIDWLPDAFDLDDI